MNDTTINFTITMSAQDIVHRIAEKTHGTISYYKRSYKLSAKARKMLEKTETYRNTEQLINELEATPYEYINQEKIEQLRTQCDRAFWRAVTLFSEMTPREQAIMVNMVLNYPTGSEQEHVQAQA